MDVEKKIEKIEKSIVKKYKKLLKAKFQLYKEKYPDRDLDDLDILIRKYGDMYARYVRAEDGLIDIAHRFSQKYHEKVEAENAHLDVTCPLCESELIVGVRGYDSAECSECEAVIFVKQITDAFTEYLLVNHGIPTIKGAVTVEVPIPDKYRHALIPPAIFSNKIYAQLVRGNMIRQITNHGVILKIDECRLT